MSWIEQKMQISRQEGRQEGASDALRTVIREQLHERFGTLPQTVEDWLASVSLGELRAAVRRVVTAGTLDEVLGT